MAHSEIFKRESKYTFQAFFSEKVLVRYDMNGKHHVMDKDMDNPGKITCWSYGKLHCMLSDHIGGMYSNLSQFVCAVGTKPKI